MKHTLRRTLALAAITVSTLAGMADATPSLSAAHASPDAMGSSRNEVGLCYSCPAWLGGLLFAGSASEHDESQGAQKAG